ncbi:MAG: HAD family hydrolase [Spirochaetales bacterium]|nr:HAD family hydrolase [Spirochaetales bacterium]
MNGLVIFDLDGTLLNTLEGIRHHLNAALVAHGIEGIDPDTCRQRVGRGLRRLVEDSIDPGRGNQVIDLVVKDLVTSYRANPTLHTKPYPGIVELVQELAASGLTLAIATNKDQEISQALVSHFLPPVFHRLVGATKGFPQKPDPWMVNEITKDLPPLPRVFVGDTEVDVETAIAANLPFAGVRWGFRSLDALKPVPTYLSSTALELKNTIIYLLSGK